MIDNACNLSKTKSGGLPREARGTGLFAYTPPPRGAWGGVSLLSLPVRLAGLPVRLAGLTEVRTHSFLCETRHAFLSMVRVFINAMVRANAMVRVLTNHHLSSQIFSYTFALVRVFTNHITSQNFGLCGHRPKHGTSILFVPICLSFLFATTQAQPSKVIVGAEQLEMLLPLLKEKRVGLVVNNTSFVKRTHLADTLFASGIQIKKIFGPEHGFRGDAADGDHVNDAVDAKTGAPVVSLYGKNNKPTAEQLSDLDIVIFDIQDVGARFYTYISTLHLVMEACAENGKKLIILDRPNPNGSYVDGPIRQPELKSFVGMHAIPITHGMTVGEFAQMLNGEGWLTGMKKCELQIIKIKNWKHTDNYSVPIRPSPNLPNDQAIRLYPSLCLFEGTVISVGRGTPTPFQIIGNPELKEFSFSFTPVPIKGYSTEPPQKDKLCFGIDLRSVTPARKVDLQYLLMLYEKYPDKEKFFLPYFDKLAGTTKLKQQIKDGFTEAQIRKSWKPGLDKFKVLRKKYLIYN